MYLKGSFVEHLSHPGSGIPLLATVLGVKRAFVEKAPRQNFRVAVALGIGRYAGRNGARFESMIIDEGFASLNRQNQLKMADSIRALADDYLFKRIMVVSHQEAFADRLPDSIHVEPSPNGSRLLGI